MNLVSRIFRRPTQRDGRVSVQFYHTVKILIGEDEFDVKNISAGGLGFLVTNKSAEFKKGNELAAVVKFNDEFCDIQMKIAHVSNNIVGCRVIGTCEVYVEYVKNFFNSELQGLNLREIDRGKLKSDNDGEGNWFYGDVNHELYFTTEGEEVTTFQINYQGNMIIMNAKKEVTFGEVHEEDRPGDYKTSNLISPKRGLPADLKLYVLRFMEVIQTLDPKLKKQITSKIE